MLGNKDRAPITIQEKNRKIKYRLKRVEKRIKVIKRSLIIVSMCAAILFSFSILSEGTHSYFNAAYTASFDSKNAKKEDLVTISQGELIYEDKCIAKQPVTIENIFDYPVKVSIGDNVYILQPGESITHTQQVAKNCGDFGEKSFFIIGYDQYFEHRVNVVVDKNKLNPCPEPSDNGQGRENDNGEGKHCGNNGNPVHDDPNNTDTVETIEGRLEETVEAPMNNEVSVESLEVADLVTEETPEEEAISVNIEENNNFDKEE